VNVMQADADANAMLGKNDAGQKRCWTKAHA